MTFQRIQVKREERREKEKREVRRREKREEGRREKKREERREKREERRERREMIEERREKRERGGEKRKRDHCQNWEQDSAHVQIESESLSPLRCFSLRPPTTALHAPRVESKTDPALRHCWKVLWLTHRIHWTCKLRHKLVHRSLDTQGLASRSCFDFDRVRAGNASALGHGGPDIVGAGGVRDFDAPGEDGHSWRIDCFGLSEGAERECEKRCSVRCPWRLRLGRC